VTIDKNTLYGIRNKLLRGGIRGGPCHDNGVFWPGNVIPPGIRTSDTVKRHLKAAGYAEPTGQRDGLWRLTDKGRDWLAGGS
jgi:hypothetical protein